MHRFWPTLPAMSICSVIGVLLLAVIGWLAVGGLRLRDLARGPWIVCAGCGHMLLEGQVTCPECGRAWDAQAVAQLRRARARSGTVRLVIAGILGALLLGVVALILWHALMEP